MHLRSGDYTKRRRKENTKYADFVETPGSAKQDGIGSPKHSKYSRRSQSAPNFSSSPKRKIPSRKRASTENTDAMETNGNAEANAQNKTPKEEQLRLKELTKEFLKKKRMLQREMNFVKRKATRNNIPHTWLGAGTLLRLMDPAHNGNYVIFQRVWRREQPLIVSHVAKQWDSELWNPTIFSNDFGGDKNDIINWVTGEVIPNQPMQIFWDGFEDVSKRIKDENGIPMLLKLKEWPEGSTFENVLPSQMNDFLEILPISSYTHPRGLLNCLNTLPEGYVKQDLGTKLFCTYGSTDYLSTGTMKLQINECDGLGLMVYVGIAKNGENENEDIQKQKVVKALRNVGCDSKSIERVTRGGETPGAVWHIFNLEDVDKIKEYLSTLTKVNGNPLPLFSYDPIQDGTWYLDDKHRERLLKEYRVEGRAILQCLGDTVLIPAGAPHQVHSLHSCITVMHSFVSRQNVKKLTLL